MQNTRLSTIFNVLGNRVTRFFDNPWRRISLVLIGLLLGVFLGTAIPTTAGQTADWDIIAAGVLIIFTEAANRLVYRRNNRKTLVYDVLNAFKIGLTYSLFVEAFKLGS
jgi:hypothetical protein